MAGHVRARATRLFNTGVRDLLGGNAVTTANVRYGTDGVVRFSQLRLTAPLLRVTGGQGSYSPDGRIRLAARATSRDYGPLGVEVGGKNSDPPGIPRAERPGLGLGPVDPGAWPTGGGGAHRPPGDGGARWR